jgi:hypothetical protein
MLPQNRLAISQKYPEVSSCLGEARIAMTKQRSKANKTSTTTNTTLHQ